VHPPYLKNAPIFKEQSGEQAAIPCNETTECNQIFCPAYNRWDIACWRVPKTLCRHHGAYSISQKFTHCLTCSVFETRAEADPRGWGKFVSDEVEEFIKNQSGSLKIQRLEDDLELAERKYRRLFEGSKDLIFLTYLDGSFRDVNQACVDILGYRGKQGLLSLGSVEKLFDKSTHWKVFKRQIDRDGFVKDFEALFRRKDCKRRHCLLSGNAIRDKYNEIIGYQGIAKDITARTDVTRNFYQRHRELWVLSSVAYAMNTTQDLNIILKTALEKVLKVLNLKSGGIFLIDCEKSSFVLRAKQGLPEYVAGDAIQVQFYDKLLMQSLLGKNLSLDPEPIFPAFRVFYKGNHVKPFDLICFLITAKGKASGFLALEIPKDKDLTVGQDFHLLGSLGNFLGGAVENNQLLQTIRSHREELKKLTAMLFHSQEQERRRIARELHDEVGQAITGINFTLDSVQKVAVKEPHHIHAYISEIKKQTHRTYQEIRRLSHHLHPAILTDLGLKPAIETYLKSILEHCDLKIDFIMIGFEKRVNLDIEGVLYRLSQEAVTNTLKHARATWFKLSIIKSYPNIIFLAQDNGIGFDTEEIKNRSHSLGLLSMRERAAMLDGKFNLRTAKGDGVRIRIEIPIKESVND